MSAPEDPTLDVGKVGFTGIGFFFSHKYALVVDHVWVLGGEALVGCFRQEPAVYSWSQE